MELLNPIYSAEAPVEIDSDLKTSNIIDYASHLKKKEEMHRIDAKYMEKQKQINAGMRSILVDWLVDVGVHFEVMNETLHMAIHYTDKALSEMEIPKS